jgi:hypothetical protein
MAGNESKKFPAKAQKIFSAHQIAPHDRTFRFVRVMETGVQSTNFSFADFVGRKLKLYTEHLFRTAESRGSN